MTKSSKSEEENGRYQELLEQLNDLEQEWESLKNGKLHNTRRFSTGSESYLTYNQLLENSPRGLMYSLQRWRSPSDVSLRDRNYDMVVEEVLRKRRAAIVSGKLKGRRLFGTAEGEREVELYLDYDDGSAHDDGCRGDVCCDLLDATEEREIVISEINDCREGREESQLPDTFLLPCSFSDVSLSNQKEVVVEKKLDIGGSGVGGGGGRCIVAVGWLVVLFILLILGLVSISCNGKSVHENELILVPT